MATHASTLALHFSELLRSVGHYLGYGRDMTKWDASVLEVIEETVHAGYRQMVTPPPIGGRIHQWRCLQPVVDISFYPEFSAALATDMVPAGPGGYIVEADAAGFLSGHATGSRELYFPERDVYYTILEYINTTRVRVATSRRSVSMILEIPSGTVTRRSIAGASRIVEVSSTAIDATEIRVGDYVGTARISEIITPPASATGTGVYRVESTSQSISNPTYLRRDTIATNLSQNTLSGQSVIHLPAGVLLDDTGTLSGFVGGTVDFGTLAHEDYGGAGSTYDIYSTTDTDTSHVAIIDSLTPYQTEEVVDGVPTTVLLKTATTALATNVTDTSSATSTVDVKAEGPGSFTSSMADRNRPQYIAFDGTTSPYKIVRYESPYRVVVEGNAHRIEEGTSFEVVYAFATYSTALTTTPGDNESTFVSDSSVFASYMQGMMVKFDASGKSYQILGYTNATTVILSGDVTGESPAGAGPHTFRVYGAVQSLAGEQFTVTGTGSELPLPEDFAGIDGPITYAAGAGYAPVQILGEGRIRQLQQQNPTTTGRPEKAAVRPVKHSNDDIQRYELLLFPAPDQTYIAYYRQLVMPDKLTIDPDRQHPFGGMPYAECLKCACLSVAELEHNDVQGPRYAAYLERLQATIAHDLAAHTPDHMGYNANTGENYNPHGASYWERNPNGVTYLGASA